MKIEFDLRTQRYMSVGRAMKTIRDRRLFRGTHRSFDEYVESRWGYPPQIAHYWIEQFEEFTAQGYALPFPVGSDQMWRAEATPEKAQPSQKVYFIGSVEMRCVKIGVTRNVDRRIAGLQTACPCELTIFAVIDGDKSTERALHSQFAEHRRHGEWFELSDDIQDFIDRISADENGTE